MSETADYWRVANIWSIRFAPLLERWGFVVKQFPYEVEISKLIDVWERRFAQPLTQWGSED